MAGVIATAEIRFAAAVADANASARNAQPGGKYGAAVLPARGTCRACGREVPVTRQGRPYRHGPNFACPGRDQVAA